MKRILQLTIISTLVFFMGCQLVELETAPSTGDETEEEVIQGPTSTPGEESVFLDFLHSDSQKTWSASGFTIAGISGFQDCRLDDIITINSDGTYTYDGGTTLCGAEDNLTNRNGTWEKVSNESQLIFDKGTSMEYTANVTGLSDSQIVLSGSYLGLEIRGAYSISQQ